MNTIEPLIIKTWKAALNLRRVSDQQLKKALQQLADALLQNKTALLKANQKDLEKQDAGNPRTDRLLLNEQRINSIANSIRSISKLPNPVGKTMEKRRLNNGLLLQKISVPLGVVGAIHESRPNVTFD